MTRINNALKIDSPDVKFRGSDGSILEIHLFKSLVFASCQVPRLLRIAHKVWYTRQLSGGFEGSTYCLKRFEVIALKYYREMKAMWTVYSDKDVAHILLSCGVHYKGSLPFVPGTNIRWSDLIKNALVFPHLDECFVIPFELIWSGLDDTERRVAFKAVCDGLVKNLDIEDLFMAYNSIFKLDLYDLGIRFERFFVSSLAAKFYIYSCAKKGPYKFNEVYDIGDKESEITKSLLEPYFVDFRDGIHLPTEEAFVDSPSLPVTAIVHNRGKRTAHHDVILPLINKGTLVNVPVSIKASFALKWGKSEVRQLLVSKKEHHKDTLVPLLIWLYLGNDLAKESKYETSVAFLNSSGCCSGLSLDKFKMLKKVLASKE
jgi:hypothetical protein